MNKIPSTISRLCQPELYSCLKISQLSLAFLIGILFVTSCGKAVNPNKSSSGLSNVSFLMMESQCTQQAPNELPISKNIKALYQKLSLNSAQHFYSITPRSYNVDSPLIMSIEKMESSYNSISRAPDLSQKAEDLFYLYSGDRRFEDQKCSFEMLKKKKKFDLRPFLNLGHNCLKKYGSEACQESEYLAPSKDYQVWLQDNVVGLCKSFSEDINCQAEYSINQRKKSLGSMINYYYKRFQSERYETLFKLRSTHSKFNCQSIKDSADQKIIMKIKVLDSSFDHDWLLEVLNYTEKTWSRKNFELKLELVKQYASDVLSIIPTSKGTSYVPDNNNRLIYLNATSDLTITKRIFAHEFGHVLGFPDCYIEFFDDSKKELVYYEISKSNTNIMCSLKEGVQVPDDYFTQLAENSCLFN